MISDFIRARNDLNSEKTPYKEVNFRIPNATRQLILSYSWAF